MCECVCLCKYNLQPGLTAALVTSEGWALMGDISVKGEEVCKRPPANLEVTPCPEGTPALPAVTEPPLCVSVLLMLPH